MRQQILLGFEIYQPRRVNHEEDVSAKQQEAQKTHGFRARMATKAAGCIEEPAAKGRKRLSVSG